METQNSRILILSGEDPWLVPKITRVLGKAGLSLKHLQVRSLSHERGKAFKIFSKFHPIDLLRVTFDVFRNWSLKRPEIISSSEVNHELLSSYDYVFLINYPYRIKLADFPCSLFNCHPSLLPRYKGLMPITRMFDDKDFSAMGASIHLLEAEIDTGEVIWTQKIRADSIYQAYCLSYTSFSFGIMEIVASDSRPEHQHFN